MKRVFVIGGVERSQHDLERVAKEKGWEFDYHGGHMQGRGTTTLETRVGRADLVLVATDVNSHGATKHARALCDKHGKKFVLVRSCGTSRFRDLLTEHA